MAFRPDYEFRVEQFNIFTKSNPDTSKKSRIVSYFMNDLKNKLGECATPDEISDIFETFREYHSLGPQVCKPGQAMNALMNKRISPKDLNHLYQGLKDEAFYEMRYSGEGRPTPRDRMHVKSVWESRWMRKQPRLWKRI